VAAVPVRVLVEVLLAILTSRRKVVDVSAKTRRVALYARLSVTTEESVSIERQLSSARRYAESRGWEVVEHA
jgi:hypothetical protein